MDSLARKLGMSKKTLYVHFASKDAIIMAAIEAFAHGLRTEVEAILAQRRITFAEKLRAFAEAVAVRLGRLHPEFLTELLEFAPHIHRHLEQVRSQNMARIFGRFVEAGQLSGTIRDDVSPVFAGEFYMHAMQGMMNGATLARLKLTPTKTFDQALQIFYAGLLTPKGQKEYEKSFPR